MFYSSIYDTIIGLFDSIYAFQCNLNVILERTEPCNTVQCIFICTDCSIREYRSDFSSLCWHCMPAYYALNYAGIFNGGLPGNCRTKVSCTSSELTINAICLIIVIKQLVNFTLQLHVYAKAIALLAMYLLVAS